MDGFNFKTLCAEPQLVTIDAAAKLLGIGRTKAWTLVRDGEFPVEVVRLGKLRRVRLADLRRFLHLDRAAD